MAYIGNIPAEKFTSVDIQNFTVSATANYTLDRPVANENEIELFINNVRQHPGSGKAYTASGTALTLSEATAGTDTMYCVYQGKARQTVTPATSSVTNAMLAGSIDLTSKVTGALPQANIADQAINEAKMQISNAPTNGYMLTAQSGNTGGLTWAEAPSGALTLISATAVTDGVSAFNINSVFSSSYQMYMMIVQNIRITADANVRLRFVASGTANSTSQYRYVGAMTDRSGTDRTYHDGSDSSMRIVANLDGNDGLSHAFGVYYIANPYISATNSNRKRVTGHYNVANESGNSVLTTCNFAGELEVSTTAFDGIRLLVDSGNFRGGVSGDGDGMIKIYGIADS